MGRDDGYIILKIGVNMMGTRLLQALLDSEGSLRDLKSLTSAGVFSFLSVWFILKFKELDCKEGEDMYSIDYEESEEKIMRSFGYSKSFTKFNQKQNRLFMLTLEKPDPIDLYCMAFREAWLIMFKLESKLSFQRMMELSNSDEKYIEWIDSQLTLQDTILNNLITLVLIKLNVPHKPYIALYSTITSETPLEDESEIEYQKDFYAKLDETNSQINSLINGWVDESVRDTLDVIESKYSDYKLKQMDEYMKTTELMIFNNIVKSIRLITRKEYRKAMLIRKDEFLKTFGITIDHAEAYFRVKD